MTHPKNTLLDAKDLSAQIGMSVSTIYRKRSLGEPLPRALKIGSAVRWRQTEVDLWLEGQLEQAV
ncbi:helix-turn-helix domain-containing protein [Microbacterium sp. NPDC089321]|uniref:helix-turn-helix transcriptional regulator n=1 Tax=Micrococcales TaxID=85006 RepID=UPI000C7C7FC7|nr:helix-turn-helix domain-containing protein [Zhihengliuella sp. ISTPL4]